MPPMRALAAFLLPVALLNAAVEPSALFSDHAVLRRAADTPVFGFASPGEKVCVKLGAAAAEGVADAKGAWLVRLDLRKAPATPQTLAINERAFQDVLVGEVWLCSGQSNMSLKMRVVDDAKEANAQTNELLRCFVISSGVCVEPLARVRGRWLKSRPGEVLAMTAVGWHFADRLQRELKCPIGIVEAAVGAASLEAWCDPQAMAATPGGRRILEERRSFTSNYRDYENACQAELRAWERKHDRTDRPHGASPADGWRALTEHEITRFTHPAGAVWLRRSLPPDTKGKGYCLSRVRFIEKQWRFDDSCAEVFFNGRKLELTYPKDPIAKNTEFYRILPEAAAAGGILELRFFNAILVPGVTHYLQLDGRALDPAGWELADEYRLKAVTGAELADRPKPQRFCLRQHYPVGLHNGFIAPIVPMGLSGVIWYQGESNTIPPPAGSGPEAYATLFPAFIRSWRALFRRPELPFAWCQLAAYQGKASSPEEADDSWAVLRASQQSTLALPMTGQAVLIDAGESRDIHPRDKRTPGNRLAAWALNRVYGRREVPYRGPHATAARREGAALRVEFADAEGGLVVHDLGTKYLQSWESQKYGEVKRNSPDAEVEGFAIAGADGKWFWADKAQIKGNEVVVSSARVPEPVKVRYAWSVNPWVNLYNRAGFPAEPFSRHSADAVVKASDFGWNAEDATECLQKAIDSGAKEVVVDKQAGDWIVRPIYVSRKSNLVITVADGVTVMAKAGEFHNKVDSLFRFSHCRNVVFRGEGSAKCVMRKRDYGDIGKYCFSEWRHAVAIYGGENIAVRDLELRSSGGDGVYVRDNAKGVKLLNVKCYDHHRQGISLISCTDFYAKDCVFNDTDGTAPKCGIDLEPNLPRDRLVNVVFEDCVFDGNDATGIKFHLPPLNGTAKPVSCVFRRCRCRGNAHYALGVNATTGRWLGKDGPGPVKGTILFEECTGENNRGGAIFFENMCAAGLEVTVRNCAFDCRGIEGSGVKFGGEIPFDFANLVCENVRILTDKEPKIAFTALAGVGAANCRGAITFVGKDGGETVVDLAKWAAERPRNPELLEFDTAVFDYGKLVPVQTGMLKKPSSTGWIDRGFTFVQLCPEPGEYKLVIDVTKRQPNKIPHASYHLRDRAGTDLGEHKLANGRNEIVLKSHGKGLFRIEVNCGAGKASVTSQYPGHGVIASSFVHNFWRKGRRYFSVPGSAPAVRVQVKIDGDKTAALYNGAGEKVAGRKADDPGSMVLLGKREATGADEVWSIGFDDNLWLNRFRIGAPALPIVSTDPDAVITVK